LVYRIVIDPGVLVAALLNRSGTPARIVRALVAGEVEMVVSPSLLSELERVLLRPKFRRYASERETLRYVGVIRRLARLVDDPQPSPGLTPDPGDDYLLALAIAEDVDFLISGDAHLLDLPSPGPPVLAPRAFVELLQERS
jgi:putative PIN family toxin of toxin-antitoxin system